MCFEIAHVGMNAVRPFAFRRVFRTSTARPIPLQRLHSKDVWETYGGQRFRGISLVPRPSDTGNDDNDLAITPANIYDVMFDAGTNGASDPAWIWLKTQIDYAQSLLGVNLVTFFFQATVRAGDSSHHGAETWRGALTQTQFANFFALLAGYLQSKSMFLYIALAEASSVDPLTDAAFIAYLTEVAALVSNPTYPNVIAIDIITEPERSTWARTVPNVIRAVTTVRAALQRSIPLTFSMALYPSWLDGATSIETDTSGKPLGQTCIRAGIDFMDQHSFQYGSALTLINTINPARFQRPIIAQTGIPQNGLYQSAANEAQETVHPYSSELIARHFQDFMASLGRRVDLQTAYSWAAMPEWAAPNQDWGLLGTTSGAQGNLITFVSNSVANPTVIQTVSPHGLNNGDQVTIDKVVGSTPALNDALYTVTVTDSTHFTVPVNVTIGGTGGFAAAIDPTKYATVRTNKSGPFSTIATTPWLSTAARAVDLSGPDTTFGAWATQSTYMLGWGLFDYSDTFTRSTNRVKRPHGGFAKGVVNGFEDASVDNTIIVEFEASQATLNAGQANWTVSVRHQGSLVSALNPNAFYLADIESKAGDVVNDGLLSIWKIDPATSSVSLTNVITVQPFNLTHRYRLTFSAIGNWPTVLTATLFDITAASQIGTLTINDSTAGLQGAGSCGLPVNTGTVFFNAVSFLQGADLAPTMIAPVIGAATPTTLPVTWSAPAGGVGTIWYVPQWTTVDGYGFVTADWSLMAPQTGTSVTFTGLTAGVRYAVRILVFDSSSDPLQRVAA